jgi:hypothetical protein
MKFAPRKTLQQEPLRVPQSTPTLRTIDLPQVLIGRAAEA